LRGSNDRDTLDVTVDVWKLLKVMEEVDHSGGRITLSALAELARGLGGGSFAIANAPKRGKGKVVDDKGFLDVAKLCGAKVALNKDVSWISDETHKLLTPRPRGIL
jgi:ATP-dependent DNA helicase Q1